MYKGRMACKPLGEIASIDMAIQKIKEAMEHLRLVCGL